MKRFITLLLLCLLILVSIYYFYSKQSRLLPHANKSSEPSIIWGKVLDEQNNAVPGITINIGSRGTKIGQSGQFYLITPQHGRLPIYFTDSKGNITYELAGTLEQRIFVGPNTSKERDFVIKPITH